MFKSKASSAYPTIRIVFGQKYNFKDPCHLQSFSGKDEPFKSPFKQKNWLCPTCKKPKIKDDESVPDQTNDAFKQFTLGQLLVGKI